jgi:hypothetical protein
MEKKLPQLDADHHRENFTLGMYHKKYQLAQRNLLGKVSEEINLCPLHNPSKPSLTHGSSMKVDMFSSNLFLPPNMKVHFCRHTSPTYISN